MGVSTAKRDYKKKGGGGKFFVLFLRSPLLTSREVTLFQLPPSYLPPVPSRPMGSLFQKLEVGGLVRVRSGFREATSNPRELRSELRFQPLQFRYGG
jgi:hypothetical protein